MVDTPDEKGWILVYGTERSGSLLCADFRDGDVW